MSHCAAVPVQTFGAPGQPEEPDTIHQTLNPLLLEPVKEAARSPKQVILLVFWMMALLVRAPDVRRHRRQEDSNTVTGCQRHRPASRRPSWSSAAPLFMRFLLSYSQTNLK